MWNAHFFGKCVELYEKGENGMAKVLAHIEMPADNCTCPSLGGPDLDWLFVTSANTKPG
jgi:sugar lactone lactonase YvrE